MKKTNVKTKKEINIFVILAIIAAVLIVVMVGISTFQKLEVQGMINDYISHQYGTKGNAKMTHTMGTDDYGQEYDMWLSSDEKYVYDVINDLIIDNDRITAASEAAVTNVEDYMAATYSADSMAADNISYYVYTDTKDVTKDYSALVIYIVGSFDTIIESTDEAAEIAWGIIQSVEGYETMTGAQINVFDKENEYNIYVDPFEGNAITLDAVKEGTLLATEKSYIYQIWQSTLADAEEQANEAIENGEVAEDSTEPEAE